MSSSEHPPSRRDARLKAEQTRIAEREQRVRSSPSRRRMQALVGVAGVVAMVLGVVALVNGLSGPSQSNAAPAQVQTQGSGESATVPPATGIPAPAQTSTAVESAAALCDDPAVAAALAGGSDTDVIAAFGGASAFREAVASGAAPCITLSDAHRTWVVVNKQRPLDPLDYEPDEVWSPQNMDRTADVRLRPEAADALTALVAAAQAEGAGSIGLNSAYRSFASQTRTYGGYVRSIGEAAADLQSARPGYSEHQTGLAADVMACTGGCGEIEGFGGTSQSEWVIANAWRFGYIVRYEDASTDVTGYSGEAWHLRYIGPALAEAYHAGGFHTLEAFFGLPAAPGY